MRLFLATSFPSVVLDDLNERVSRFKSRLPAASWVRPGTQHLTLAFLGEQPETLVDSLTSPMTKAVAAEPRFGATLKGCGFFPNPRHARVGWIGLDPEEKFRALAKSVRDVVLASAVSLDGADFKPHLTLMRMREGWPPASIDLFSKTLRDFRSEPFEVTEVTLFSSQLHQSGAIHTPLRMFALA